MPDNPLDAYRSVEKSTLSGRQLEASVLSKAALKLQQAQRNWQDPDHVASLDEALKYNQRVWTFFQSEVSLPDNPLPAEIKSNILALSVFVDRRTFEVMAYPTPEKLDILISINRNLAAGLQGDVG
ncbi:MAG TPA: flagellar biosynthesis regulator FlaF [Thiobacillaceae bacterium]|nr:flagellar biosynthesis regulator FlaF [Thiobacillaceae bacterium]HNU65121.1 flagellar biosynthesis regulator FlaF [Thiobacillaceae bacterium]